YDSLELLSQRIDESSRYTSSRFQHLAQEHLLIGQIATALLTRADGDSAALILPSTLHRIANDLERQGHAGTWIRGAAQTAQAIRAKGVKSPPSDVQGKSGWEPSQIQKLNLGPRIALRQVGPTDWDVLASLPDL